MGTREGYLGIPIAPTRCMAEGDLLCLVHELEVVERFFDSSQAKERRWEYALALRALNGWIRERPQFSGAHALDVGGYGSPFWQMLDEMRFPAHVIDEKLGTPLEVTLASAYPLVFCISVVEHVPDLEDFCAHLARVTSPGGLLFLTSDIWGEAESEPDKAKWHWDRMRIFTPAKWRALYEETFSPLGFALLGEADWRYHGALMRGEDGSAWGYSLCSMALVKEI